MKTIYKPFIAFGIFVLVQLIGGLAGAIAVIVINMLMGGAAKVTVEDLMCEVFVITDVLTIIFAFLLRVINKRAFSFKDISWSVASIGIVGAFVALFVCNLVNEYFDLPDNMGDTFLAMSQSTLGVIAIALLGPIAEEVIFREGIIGNMLKCNINPWIAILTSSVVFGIIHLNPIQIPFAIFAGVIFGIIYIKTQNIVVTSILHVINNSLAVLQMCLMGDAAKDFSFRTVLGSATIPIIIVLLVISFLFLKYFYTHHSSPKSN